MGYYGATSSIIRGPIALRARSAGGVNIASGLPVSGGETRSDRGVGAERPEERRPLVGEYQDEVKMYQHIMQLIAVGYLINNMENHCLINEQKIG